MLYIADYIDAFNAWKRPVRTERNKQGGSFAVYEKAPILAIGNWIKQWDKISYELVYKHNIEIMKTLQNLPAQV